MGVRQPVLRIAYGRLGATDRQHRHSTAPCQTGCPSLQTHLVELDEDAGRRPVVAVAEALRAHAPVVHVHGAHLARGRHVVVVALHLVAALAA